MELEPDAAAVVELDTATGMMRVLALSLVVGGLFDRVAEARRPGEPRDVAG